MEPLEVWVWSRSLVAWIGIHDDCARSKKSALRVKVLLLSVRHEVVGKKDLLWGLRTLAPSPPSQH